MSMASTQMTSSVPLLESVRFLSKEAQLRMKDETPMPSTRRLPVPTNIEAPFNVTTSYAPCMVVLPKMRTENGLIQYDGPSRFCVWVNVNGTIEYSFFEDDEWSSAISPKFSVRTVVAAPVAINLEGEVYIAWVEKESGIQLAKIGGRNVTNVAPYCFGMKNGIAMVLNKKSARLVIAWNDNDSTQFVTVDSTLDVSAPVSVVDHKGPFSMAIWRDRIYLITGGNRVMIYVIDANSLVEIDAIETPYKSQGAVRLTIGGSSRPHFVLAWSDSQSRLNMRTMLGLHPGELDLKLVSVHKEVSLKSTPALALDPRTMNMIVSWVDLHNSISVGHVHLGEAWTIITIATSPLIWNASNAGTWQFVFSIGPSQPAPVPSFRTLICTLPTTTTPTAYTLGPTVLTFNAPSYPYGWYIRVQYRLSGTTNWQECKGGMYDQTPLRWDFWTNFDNTGWWSRMQIMPPY